MGTKYIKNHLGFKLSEEEMAEIPYPYTELVIHVTYKNWQSFALLGTVLFGPLAALARRSTRNLAGLAAMTTKAGKFGLIASPFTSVAMTYATVKKDPIEKIIDRDFRLRYSRSQVRVDQASFIGSVGGTAIGMAKFANPILGLTLGMTSGVVAASLYNTRVKK